MLCASYNIQFGRGKDERFDLSRIVAELGDPDRVALQEVESFVSRSGDLDQAEAIAAAQMPHMHWVFGAGIDAHASITHPDGRVENRRRRFGNMVLSRWPVLSAANHLLSKHALHAEVHLRRALLECVIDTPIGERCAASAQFDRRVSGRWRSHQGSQVQLRVLVERRRGGPCLLYTSPSPRD